jgi:hypothetical protein
MKADPVCADKGFNDVPIPRASSQDNEQKCDRL